MKLTDREKLLVKLLLVVLIVYLTYYFVINPQLIKIDNHKLALEESKARVQKAKADIEHMNALEEKVVELQKDREESIEVFYPSIQQKKIILILDQVLSDSQLTSEKIIFSENETVEMGSDLGLERINVTVPYIGSYDQVTAFFEKIAEQNRMIKVNYLHIREGETSEVEGSINIDFYAISKPVDQDTDKEYLDWTLENDSGRENPFVNQTVQE